MVLDGEFDLEGLARTGQQLGMDQQDLARIIGVDTRTLDRWRTGRRCRTRRSASASPSSWK